MAVEFTFAFPLPQGLHVRPAGIIQEAAERFAGEVIWENLRSGVIADGKSVLSLIGSDTQANDPCRIRFQGPGENEALQAFRSLIQVELPRMEREATMAPAIEADIPRILTQERTLFFRGIPASRGVVIGPALILETEWNDVDIEKKTGASNESEKGFLFQAMQRLEGEMHASLKGKNEKTEQSVLRALLSILLDRAFSGRIVETIESEACSAAAAVQHTCRFFCARLQASRSQYLRERMADIRDVSHRLIALLSGISGKEGQIRIAVPSILIADDLLPSRFLSLDLHLVLGLVLEGAGITSHTLIMCRARGIPALTGCPGIRRKLNENEEILIDGSRGLVIPSPTPALGRYFDREMEVERERSARYRRMSVQPGQTADNRRVEIAANIGDPQELEMARECGAESIGLFRSEFMLSGRETPPNEEEQTALYTRLARESEGRPVIVRTFDIGGDKPIPYLHLPEESNPFLGFRGIRIYEKHADLIRVQLRSILRAATYGPLQIMFPMVSCIEEIVTMQEWLRDIRSDLAAGSVAHRPDVKIGMMVEVPSAALSIGSFCDHVDFFSVGSNDLLQYFFASDRGNPAVRHLNQPQHPAFLRLLQSIVDAAHAKGKWIGLCGEMAASPRFLPLLVAFGFDELSMSCAAIPEIKERLRRLNSEDCHHLLVKALGCSCSREVDGLLDSFSLASEDKHPISPALVCLDSDSRSKAEALQELGILMERAGRVDSRHCLEQELWQREETFSTGIGFGIAVPHCQTRSVRGAAIAFLRFCQPLEWDSTDGQPVEMALMLAIPATGHASREHLQMLARLSRCLVHEEFRDRLRQAAEATEIIRLISSALEE